MMSKEAKIGLLFSLVFIVALAVILRSVHQDGTNSGAENDIMDVDKSPIANSNLSSAVQALTEDRPQSQSQPDPVRYQQPAETNNRMTELNSIESDRAMVPAAANTIRYTQPLPTLNDNNNTIRTTPPTGQVQRAINSMNSSVHSDRIPSGTGQGTINTLVPAKKSEPVSNLQKVIHTVAKGDNLTKIAMKYYGKKEGNRLTNIEKIFEANRDILSSMSDLKVGQRLTIPPLPGVETKKSTGGVTGTSSSSKGKYRTYVVKEDDSLWKIAAKELGNGTRYPEIAKLNDRILSDENTLRPGMKIKLPE